MPAYFVRSTDTSVHPRVAVRGPFAAWQAAGGKDAYALAGESAEALAAAGGCPLDAVRAGKRRAIVEGFDV